MVLHIFTVFDSKAEAFMTPFFMTSKGQAVRAFSDTVQDPSHQFNKHPCDYTLFYLGTFSDDSSTFKTITPPVSLGMAVEFITPKPTDPRQLALDAACLSNSDDVVHSA